MIENGQITQQNCRRIPIQLKDPVDSEIEKLLKDGHSEKWINYKFIHPTVIRLNKTRR